MSNNISADFIDRSNKGEIFSRQRFDDLQKWGFDVALNGTEHTHPEFIKRLHISDDPTSLIIRYQPDGIASVGNIPRSFYLEAKASKYIERDAYLNYIRLQMLGGIIYIVVLHNDYTGFCEIQDIEFEPIATSIFPIEDGWLCPRKRTDWLIYRKTFKGSGTPFRGIDIKCLKEWAIFKQIVIIKLSQVLPCLNTANSILK